MKIIENEKKYLKNFIQLNKEWIQKYFEIEQIDIELAENPYQIIEEGGYIFSIIEDKKVIGVCAFPRSHAALGSVYLSLLICFTCMHSQVELGNEKTRKCCAWECVS